MTRIAMYAEPLPPSGGIDARSVRRTLGTYSMDFWELFLRETLQNSWDAATGDRPAEFSVDGWPLDAGQLQSLHRLLPGADLDTSDLRVLTVTDTGTRGLTGPTRADRVGEDDPRNFVDLVRNVGRHPDKGFAGGTYGYGKAVLFEASSIDTVVIFTRIRTTAGLQCRLIGMSLTDPYRVGRRQYTGRHWWGVPHSDVGVEPITGPMAEHMARAIGLTRLSGDATGTSIMVIAPRIGEEHLSDVVAVMADTATRYAWPNTVGQGGSPPGLTLRFTCDGSRIDLPDPATDARLRYFVEAHRHCRSVFDGAAGDHPWPWTVEEIVGSRPEQRLGVLAWRTYRAAASGSHARPPAEIALIRRPGLVVEYRNVTPDPFGHAISGVFIADPELDEDFARAEPPTHDRWQPRLAQRQRYARNPVSQALNRIDRVFRERRAGNATAPTTEAATGVSRLANVLGTLLDTQAGGTDTRIPTGSDNAVPHPPTTPSGAPATHAGTPTAGNGGNGRQQANHGRGPRSAPGPALRFHPRPRQTLLADGGRAVEFDIDITGSSGASLALIAQPLVAVADGAPEPADETTPVEVLHWRDRDNGDLTPGPRLNLTTVTSEHWTVTLTQPADAAVTVRVRQEEVTPR
ncbi:hypothetical protein [Micromonospora sediminimaris]|uniref:Histidine kinase-, DNA gyrase B-, and HSP90-like ATPase n=1 Tax=Micromonospora sediminimaris TaxID=547162 RepID=A0A9W5USX0_9ACTN|nr:hypothetical protein [Micromonospora sediminimaris]GIJ34441.1 hypothetical protein Vse01_35890 [Micromonospora sediminimaris]SFD30076.1 hypothetical protein SAMN05216284_114159 [Micromonospora sediminimaris]